MSFTELVANAELAIEGSRPAEAIPLLQEIISRASSLEDESAKESVQVARLQLGVALSGLKKWSDALRYTEEYLASKPCKDPMAAYQVLCSIALANEDWRALHDAAEKILADKSLGLRKRKTAEQFLLQALYGTGDYARALELLPEVISSSKNREHIRSYRIMQVRCWFETGQIDQIISSLPVLFRGAARDDVTLNLTLLRIGDQLFERQQYLKSLIMYRLVLPKAELLVRQQERIAEQKEEIADDKNGDGAWKLEELSKGLETLRNVPDYDLHIAYRAAQIYSEQKRFWEAAVLFGRLHQKFPAKEEGKAAFLQQIMLLFELNQDDEAISLSCDYLDKNRSGLYPRMVCSQLMQHYLRKQQFDDALGLISYMDRWTAPADEDERAQETDLRYMISFTFFQRSEYDQAFAAFDKVIQTAPDSQAAIDSNYWKAMCRMLQQKYELAHDLFLKYRRDHPRAGFAPAALFRSGVCRFGLEDYEGAKKIFEQFITDYPDDALMPEALSMSADLLAADGKIDQALERYRQSISIVKDNYKKERDELLRPQMVAPATYAVFQAAQALEADAEAFRSAKEYQLVVDKYTEMIVLVEDYTTFFGKDSDWAQSTFWIGKAQIELGDPLKAVSAYLDSVIRHGADPAQEGVAAILFDMAGIIEKRLDKEQREQIVQAIKSARYHASSPTLQIRLDVLLAELDGTQSELGASLLATEKSLAAVPPSGLALMCGALLEQKDYSRSEEFFNHFMETCEGSVFMKKAYRLRAEDLYRSERYDEALELVLDVLGLYGADEETGWAQLMKGNVELRRGDYKTAAQTYNMIFNVRAWRGPVQAEAMYKMAEAWYQQKEFRKAFAFFQRTYLLYKAYDGGRWAADAYLRSADCLKQMGRESAARNTYRAMLLDEYVCDLPQSETAKKVLGPVEVAELMAAGTNAMETVEREVAP